MREGDCGSGRASERASVERVNCGLHLGRGEGGVLGGCWCACALDYRQLTFNKYSRAGVVAVFNIMSKWYLNTARLTGKITK